MFKLDIYIDSDSRYPFDRKRTRLALEQTLKEQGNVDGVYKLSLSMVGDRKIRELEQKYFGVDQVTDVLSFPMKEGESAPEDQDGINLGDIVVCYPQAKRQALQWNKSLDEEIEFLSCHGLLHLLGVHHD